LPKRIASAADAADCGDDRRHALSAGIHQVTSDAAVHDEVCRDGRRALGDLVGIAVEIELGFVANGRYESGAGSSVARPQNCAIRALDKAGSVDRRARAAGSALLAGHLHVRGGCREGKESEDCRCTGGCEFVGHHRNTPVDSLDVFGRYLLKCKSHATVEPAANYQHKCKRQRHKLPRARSGRIEGEATQRGI